MSRDPIDVFTPRILLVDDERQIHASIKLRIGREYELVSCYNAHDALEKLRTERFDLCFADIHMPRMDGFAFIEAARETDPALGFVVLSAFDTDENLRRAIPLQVFDFMGKPLPDREGFERRIPGWVERTRRQRRDDELAKASRLVAQDLASAQLAHEVELVASESARDALLQSANLLTTIHAHLLAATTMLAARAKSDPSLAPLLRSLEQGRKTAEAADSVTDGFFNSAYASRDSSPAFIDSGMRHAIEIARRATRADATNKVIDFLGFDERATARGLSGIELLLMLVPVIGVAVSSACAASTVRIRASHIARLDVVLRDSTLKNHVWLNRKNSPGSQAGIQIAFSASAAAPSRADIEAWLKGEASSLAAIAPRGLVSGLQKSHAALGIAVAPVASELALVLVVPA